MTTETKKVPYNIGRNAQKRWFRAFQADIRKELVAAIGTNNKAPKLKRYRDGWRTLLD